jgi:iron(III) transport system permease protein
MTWQNYVMLLDQDALQDTVINTLLLGVGTACCVVPFTALCSWLVVRQKKGAAWLEVIAGMPLVFPAIILSVAFLNIFINAPVPVYGTMISLVIASTVRFLPYGMRYSFAGVMQIHTDLEEAAAVSGASRWRVFRSIIVPLLITALISAWLLVFLLSVQSVSLPLLLVGPGTQVMATTLFELWQNGQVTELASMGIIWITLMTSVSVIVHQLTRRKRLTL